MSTGVPALPFELDPLIAEAKERARRRRLLALGALVVAAAVGTTYGLRSSGNAVGICATVPSGWKERFIKPSVDQYGGVTDPAVVLTNFRFGRIGYLYGMTDTRLDWPATGVLIAVSNSPAGSLASYPGALRVVRGSFGGLEGPASAPPTAHFSVQSRGRILDTYVQVGTLTPATIAAANQALAGVRTCSA